MNLRYEEFISYFNSQVRLTSQFEEGQHFSAHLLQSPAKSKFPSNGGAAVGVRVHLQNKRFSLTTGVPPKLLHSWELSDLRYGMIGLNRINYETYRDLFSCSCLTVQPGPVCPI